MELASTHTPALSKSTGKLYAVQYHRRTVNDDYTGGVIITRKQGVRNLPLLCSCPTFRRLRKLARQRTPHVTPVLWPFAARWLLQYKLRCGQSSSGVWLGPFLDLRDIRNLPSRYILYFARGENRNSGVMMACIPGAENLSHERGMAKTWDFGAQRTSAALVEGEEYPRELDRGWNTEPSAIDHRQRCDVLTFPPPPTITPLHRATKHTAPTPKDLTPSPSRYDDTTNLPCPKCPRRFKRGCGLSAHLRRAHRTQPWRCPHEWCIFHQEGFSSKPKLDDHLRGFHGEESENTSPFQSVFAGRTPRPSKPVDAQKLALRAWITELENSEHAGAGESVASESMLPTPSKSNEAVENWSAAHSDATATDVCSMKRTVRGDFHQCSRCGRLYKTRAFLLLHLRRHYRSMQPCPDASCHYHKDPYLYTNALRRHIKARHSTNGEHDERADTLHKDPCKGIDIQPPDLRRLSISFLLSDSRSSDSTVAVQCL